MQNYDRIREIVCEEKFNHLVKIRDVIEPEKGDRGNFTFYLNTFPNIRLQITSKRFFLKMYGVQMNNFIADLEVIKGVVSLLSPMYPKGVHFKLDKETLSEKDKDERDAKSTNYYAMFAELIKKALEGHGEFESYVDCIWQNIREDNDVHHTFVSLSKNYFARRICEDGFLCIPDGSITPDTLNSNNKVDQLAILMLKDAGLHFR